ncbi:MAG: hypothetical protein Q9160_008332 [Pyrenula sp. 1 TL-2023]
MQPDANLRMNEGQPAPRSAFGPARPISSHSASDRCQRLLAEWLDDCVTNHTECKVKSFILPTRLLLIGPGLPGSPIPSVRLYEPSNERVDYAALSHCWGTHQLQLITTKATLSDRKRDISWESFPKTFQDAILTTRSLGLQCLWVDALCIVQDDPQDRDRESGNMKDVYGGAFVTIASTWSSNSVQGCFSAREAEERVVWQSRYRGPDGANPKIFARRVMDHEVFREQPLCNRAWAYQEQLLSRRLIHFLPEEVRWECRTSSKCECSLRERGLRHREASYEMWSAGATPLPSDTLSHYYSTWYSLVAEYSRRGLSETVDKLPAISGLAKLIQEASNSDYLAGLWSDDLIHGLLWTSLKRLGTPNRRVPQYRAPTWSWASIDGPVQYHTWALPRFEVTCRVLGGTCATKGPDPFGQVSSGAVQIRGLTVPAVVHVDLEDGTHDMHGEQSLHERLFRGWLLRDGQSAAFAADEPIDLIKKPRKGPIVLCLQLGQGSDYHGNVETTISLVLAPCKVTKSSRETVEKYERIGVLHHVVASRSPISPKSSSDMYSPQWFHDAEEKVITII